MRLAVEGLGISVKKPCPTRLHVIALASCGASRGSSTVTKPNANDVAWLSTFPFIKRSDFSKTATRKELNRWAHDRHLSCDRFYGIRSLYGVRILPRFSTGWSSLIKFGSYPCQPSTVKKSSADHTVNVRSWIIILPRCIQHTTPELCCRSDTTSNQKRSLKKAASSRHSQFKARYRLSHGWGSLYVFGICFQLMKQDTAETSVFDKGLFATRSIYANWYQDSISLCLCQKSHDQIRR